MRDHLIPTPLPDAYLMNCPSEVFKTMAKWVPLGLFFGVINIGWRWEVPGNRSPLLYILTCGAKAGILSAAYKAPQCYYHKKKQELNGIGTMLGGMSVGSCIGFYRSSPATIIGLSALGGLLGYVAEWNDFSLGGPVTKMSNERRTQFLQEDLAVTKGEPPVNHAARILDKYAEKYNQPSIFCFR